MKSHMYKDYVEDWTEQDGKPAKPVYPIWNRDVSAAPGLGMRLNQLCNVPFLKETD